MNFTENIFENYIFINKTRVTNYTYNSIFQNFLPPFFRLSDLAFIKKNKSAEKRFETRLWTLNKPLRGKTLLFLHELNKINYGKRKGWKSWAFSHAFPWNFMLLNCLHSLIKCINLECIRYVLPCNVVCLFMGKST